MRVLWFAVTPSLYGENNEGHNGGGWISSLEELIRKENSVDLGVAFEHPDKTFVNKRDGVSYYPINVLQTRTNNIRRIIKFNTEEKLLIPKCIEIIDHFKPDLIHIFGSEWSFGLIKNYIDIPIIIHIQGSIPPYYNARFPPGYCKYDLLNWNIIKSISNLNYDRIFKLRAKREEKILKICPNFMGRTEWDKSIVNLYSPNARYYYCSEVLRQVFTNETKVWKIKKNEKIIIVSTISANLLKGLDVIFKTSKLLMKSGFCEFNWILLGPTSNDLRIIEKKENISHKQLNIFPNGVVSAEKVKNELLNSTMYIHTSYIDNSPNAICEAQLLGVPVFATYVGGIPSLVKHNVTGFLFSANDPHFLASAIKEKSMDNSFLNKIGTNGRHEALKRHNGNKIITDLLSIYNRVVDGEKN